MRLQVLHLPAPPDEYPFALILDKVADDMSDQYSRSALGGIKADLGARGVLVFRGEVEIV